MTTFRDNLLLVTTLGLAVGLLLAGIALLATPSARADIDPSDPPGGEESGCSSDNITACQCADNVDNDGDYDIDEADASCGSSLDDSEYGPPPEELDCADGEDDDGDEKVDGDDPMCEPGGGSEDNEGPPNYGTELACGAINLDHFTTSNPVPAFVQTPPDFDFNYGPVTRSPQMAPGTEGTFTYTDEREGPSGATNEEDDGEDDAWDIGDDEAPYTSSSYGFAEPLPADAAVTLTLEAAALWDPADDNDGGADNGDDGPGEYARVETTVTFRDAAGNQVAQETFVVHAGPEPEQWPGADAYISGGTPGPNGTRTATDYFTFTVNNVGGALSMGVTQRATSYDDEDDDGWWTPPNPEGDIFTDPVAWSGLVGMTVQSPTACAPPPVNDPPVANPDGSTANPIATEKGQTTCIGVLPNDDDPENDPLSIGDYENKVYDNDGNQIGSVTQSGTELCFAPMVESGQGTFRYKASDGTSLSNWTTVHVAVVDNVGQITVEMMDTQTGGAVAGGRFTLTYGGSTYNVEVPNDGSKEMYPELTETAKLTTLIVDSINVEGYEDPVLAEGDINKGGLELPPDPALAPNEAYLGLDYTDTSGGGGGGTGGGGGGGGGNNDTGWGYGSCHYCHTGDAYTYIEEWHNGVYQNDYLYAGNSSECTQELEESTFWCYDEQSDQSKPNLAEPGQYCETSGTESACWPNTDWPADNDGGGPTITDCEGQWENTAGYPNCPVGTYAETYGYPTCERTCIRGSGGGF